MVFPVTNRTEGKGPVEPLLRSRCTHSIWPELEPSLWGGSGSCLERMWWQCSVKLIVNFIHIIKPFLPYYPHMMFQTYYLKITQYKMIKTRKIPVLTNWTGKNFIIFFSLKKWNNVPGNILFYPNSRSLLATNKWLIKTCLSVLLTSVWPSWSMMLLVNISNR